MATIKVDGLEYKVRSGPWIVNDLKKATRIDLAKILAVITPMGVRDQRDHGTIEVDDGLNLMSHARAGSAS